jgi:heavy metal efflux system protein
LVRVYRYVLDSPDRSPMELKTIEDWIVERQYKSVPGVADDSGFGGQTMQYQVLLDPAKIAGAGLSVPAVVASLAANNGNAGGGFYSQGGQFYYVRGLGRLQTPEDIGNVVLMVHNGIPVLVKDVGRVVLGAAPRLGEFGYDRRDDAVEGGILMRRGEQAQVVGLLPAALSTGIGSDSQRPFALVFVGGLFSRLLISVFLMPALYLLVSRSGDRLEV